ncbi:MAG: alpha/beta hydrolase [Caulobacteraceae bacterium]|nr:alpha/beta hydrolase [Caulobacteraceae bacterium]
MSQADAAPLVALPQAPIPAGGTAEWFAGAGGLRLRAALFPAENPRGSVVLSGGRTEFIEKYLEVIGELVARGFTVLTHDWRGQGLSGRLLPDRLKGHADGFDDFVADFGLLLDRYEDRLPGPRIALAHSMGGCLTLQALTRGERRIDGAVFSAPMLGLTAQRSWPTRALVGLMGALQAGGYALGGAYDPFATTFEADRLTHDRARYDRTRALMLANRDLALGAVTWGWVASAFRTLAWLHAAPELRRLALPMVIVGAGEETLVDNAGQKLVASLAPDCRYVELAGAYHEILMETDDLRAAFWREFDALTSRLGRPKA